MKKMNKIIYAIRLFLFIIHFYLIFILINNTLSVGLLAYIFLIIDIFYALVIIWQLIYKKRKYKYDMIYNLMQIGFDIYLSIIIFKIYYEHLYVLNKTLTYFKVNFIIMSILLVFIIVYSFYELSGRKDN